MTAPEEEHHGDIQGNRSYGSHESHKSPQNSSDSAAPHGSCSPQLGSPQRSSGGRLLRCGLWCAVLAAVAAAVLPYLAAASPFRNLLLGRLARSAGIHLSAKSLNLGWLTPLSLDGLEVDSTGGSRLLSVDRIEAGKPWWKIALARPNIGQVQLVRPQVELVIEAEGTNFSGLGGNSAQPPQPLVATFVVEDASFAMRQSSDPRPTLLLSDLDAVVRIAASESERVLALDKISALERAELTPAMCRRGLQLIAPALSESTDVQGRISLAVDAFNVQLDRPNETELCGRLVLHSVEATPRSPWLMQVLGVLQSALGARTPARIRLADEARIDFRFEQGRIHHEGMEFGLPEISREMVVRTSGSVGLDESLDLDVELPRIRTVLRELVGGTATSAPLSDGQPESTPLRLRVVGSLKQPRLELLEGQSAVVKWLEGMLGPRGPDGTSVVDELLQGLGERLETRWRRNRQSQEGAQDPPSGPLRRRLRRQR